MGVIRPPWVTKKWFRSCPFNYCDHFGDKEILRKICVICREDLKHIISSEYFYETQKTSYDTWEEHTSLVIDNIKINFEDEESNQKKVPIYVLTEQYSHHIESVIQGLQSIPEPANLQLVSTCVDILSHSRHYMVIKLIRAIHSRSREKNSRLELELADSKTSAFFAYIAIKRNARALLALTRHKPLNKRKNYYLKIAAVSTELCDMIQSEFFPKDKLIYEEIGCNYFKEERR